MKSQGLAGKQMLQLFMLQHYLMLDYIIPDLAIMLQHYLILTSRPTSASPTSSALFSAPPASPHPTFGSI